MERHTVQRDIISKVVEEIEGHCTATEIYEKVIKDYPSISKSTVIRSLDIFCDQGKLAKRPIPNGPFVYDPITTDHYHVKCSKCGEIFDVDMDYIPDLASAIKDKKGFIITGHEINFTGICPKCSIK